MIRYLFVISIGLIISCKPIKFDKGVTTCTFHKTDKTPANTSPFNRSNKIELVSYQDRHDDYAKDKLIQDGKFVVLNIEQRTILNAMQSDSLFSILFNLKKVRQGNVESIYFCYNPHHSIVFYQDDRAIAYLEVCFECFTAKGMGVNSGEFCDEKWCRLQGFFKDNKIDYALNDKLCQPKDSTNSESN